MISKLVLFFEIISFKNNVSTLAIHLAPPKWSFVQVDKIFRSNCKDSFGKVSFSSFNSGKKSEEIIFEVMFLDVLIFMTR
jgi:hypothetical protein